MKRLLVVLSVALAMFSLSSVAFGQSWKDKREAQKLAARARFLVKKGDFEEAAKKFKKADDLTPSPTYKVEIAKLLVELGDFVQAGQLLQAAIDGGAQKWQEKKAIKQAQSLVEEVKERTPTLSVNVLEPSDGSATITIDGDSYDAAEGAVPFNPGTYEVSVSASGYETFTRSVKLREGDRKDVEATLKGGAPKDGEEDGEADSGRFTPIPAYISWGVSAVGLGLGIGFGVAAIQSTNDVLRLYNCEDGECPAEAEDDLKIALQNGNISTAGFVIGTVAALSGLAFTLVHVLDDDDVEEDEEPSDGLEVEARPVLGPGYVGVQGTF